MEALIGCRFEETHQGHDEAVRARIMQVLVGCFEGGAGTWLPDEVVWEVLQTCMANLDQMVSITASPNPPPLNMEALLFISKSKPLAASVGRHVREDGQTKTRNMYGYSYISRVQLHIYLVRGITGGIVNKNKYCY